MSSSHEEAVKDMRDVCRVCGDDIATMAYLGTGLCGIVCKRKDQEENPPAIPLNITLPEVDDILSAAGVDKKHRKAVADGWEKIVAHKMPHLRRVVDAGDTKDVK